MKAHSEEEKKLIRWEETTVQPQESAWAEQASHQAMATVKWES
jgi:hypothetical protein